MKENKYDMTIAELLDQLNCAAETLKGKCPVKTRYGLAGLVKDAVEDLGIDFYHNYMIDVDHCRVNVDTGEFGAVEIATFYPYYKEDKRRNTGKGDYLESVKVVLTREIPLDFKCIDLVQKLEYDVAKEHKERLDEEIKELQKEIEDRKKGVERMEEIMKYQKYE